MIENKGFESIDPNKHYSEVGIIQDDDFNTYVIVLWTGYIEVLDSDGDFELKPGTFYDIYKWKYDGLYIESEANPINYYFGETGKSNIAKRKSLDCSNLNQVIFCWEEAYTSAGTYFLEINQGQKVSNLQLIKQ